MKLQMSDKEEGSGVHMLPLPSKLTEGDDPTSQEIVALINTFADHDTSSLENDDGWKDLKAALWDSFTTGPDYESSSNRNGSFAPSNKISSAPASSQISTIRSQVYEAPEHANSSIELTSWSSDNDTASDFVDFSAKQFYLPDNDTTSDFVDFSAKNSHLPDLLKILNNNEIELLDDEEAGTTRVQFRGKEYILSNGPRENVDPFVDNVFIDGFDSFGLENRGHTEDLPPDMSEDIESNEGIFEVWDLGIPNEEDEITRQLKALAESSTGLSTQNQSVNLIEERYKSMVEADGELPSLGDLSTTLNDEKLGWLIQGVTNLSLNRA